MEYLYTDCCQYLYTVFIHCDLGLLPAGLNATSPVQGSPRGISLPTVLAVGNQTGMHWIGKRENMGRAPTHELQRVKVLKKSQLC